MAKHRMGALGMALAAVVVGLGLGFLLQGNWSSGAVAAPLAQPTPVSSGLIPRFISLDPYGAYVEDGATFTDGFGPNSGLRLPDGGTASFSLGFTLPPDYASGTPLTIRMVWHTPSTGCAIVFQPNSIAIARPGRTHIQGPGFTDGLSVVGGTTLNAPATASSSQATQIQIVSPVSGTPLQAGDVIMFSMFRSGAAAQDTCTGNMVIQGMALQYQGQTTYLPLVDD